MLFFGNLKIFFKIHQFNMLGWTSMHSEVVFIITRYVAVLIAKIRLFTAFSPRDFYYWVQSHIWGCSFRNNPNFFFCVSNRKVCVIQLIICRNLKPIFGIFFPSALAFWESVRMYLFLWLAGYVCVWGLCSTALSK